MKANKLVIPNLPNVSLVVYYGEKKPKLRAFIKKLQAVLVKHRLIDSFTPYHLHQVHGTIIGCEGIRTESGIVNRWYRDRIQPNKCIDFPGLINHLQNQAKFPLNICFGGYDLNVNYGFLSRNQHPYLRSFQLQFQEGKIIPVLIGWPWRNNKISEDIDNLRQELQNFNVLHKYNKKLDDVDNDFYLRLGTIESQLTTEAMDQIVKDVRKLFVSQPALSIPIGLEDLAFAKYRDLSLSPASTSLTPATKVTASQLEELYPQSAKII